MSDQTPTDSPEETKKSKGGVPAIFTFLLILTSLILIVNVFGGGLGAQKEISYNDFLRHLYTGRVSRIDISGSTVLAGEYLDETAENGKVAFQCDVPTGQFPLISDDLREFVNRFPGRMPAAEFLARVADQDLVPARAWLVPEKQQDLVFVDYFDGPGRRQRVQLSGDAPGQAVNVGAVVSALKARDLALEVKHVAATDQGEDKVWGYKPENTFLASLFWNIVPWLLFIGIFWFFLFRQMRSPGGAGGVLSFGRAKPALVGNDRTGITFDDVAGIEEAKNEVREIVEFLKEPARFSRVGARIPRGVLLVGSPGTGKTLLAKAIAGEAHVPFFSICGSDFVEMFVGVGASRVRDLFRQAREKSPCLIFLDEIDAVGRRRGSGLGGGHDEREQTLNAILVEMDGFETDEGIILIAATNRPDVLDPALLRPGRFDRQITIDLPDVKGREAILKVHTRNLRLEPSADLSIIARGTPGFSGAELASLVNEAALKAALDGRDRASLADMEEARDRVRFGREKTKRVMDEKERRITAYHEAGHALVGALHPGVEPLHKVTIIPRGMALGSTMTLPEKDRYHQRREQMLGWICFAYGGRLAEEMFCGDITSGAYDDIKKATQIARMMVCLWGMSDALGPINYAERDDSIFLGGEVVKHRNYSEETARVIDSEVKRILDEGYATARQTLEQHREKVEAIAQALLEYETIQGEEIESILKGATPREARAAWEKKHQTAARKPVKPAAADGEERASHPHPETGGDLPPAGEPAVS